MACIHAPQNMCIKHHNEPPSSLVFTTKSNMAKYSYSSTTTITLLPLVSVLALLLLVALPKAHGARAFFVFGDSLVDNGNNNYLLTSARADSPPYGIDYPTHRPTGRFSNGLNIPDLISKLFMLQLYISSRIMFLTYMLQNN